MLSHFARLVGIIVACKAAIPTFNWTQYELIEETKMMKRCAEMLLRALATDCPNRDEALRVIFSNPLNFALACQVVDGYHAECEYWATEYDFEDRSEYVDAHQYSACWREINVDEVLYAIMLRCYEIADAISAGTYENPMPLEPKAYETKVSLAHSFMHRNAWGPFHRHQKRPSKPKGSTLSDKRRAMVA